MVFFGFLGGKKIFAEHDLSTRNWDGCRNRKWVVIFFVSFYVIAVDLFFIIRGVSRGIGRCELYTYVEFNGT